MNNGSTDEQSITELQQKIKLVQMDDEELVSRLCLAFLENHDNNVEQEVDKFREYRQELIRRLVHRHHLGSEAKDESVENAKGN